MPITPFLLVSAFLAAVRGQDIECASVGISAAIQIQFGSGTVPVNTINTNRLSGPLVLRCHVVLTATSGGAPPIDSYNWYHNGDSLSETGLTLTIPSVQSTDGGLYICLATTSPCVTERSPAFTVNTVPELAITPSRITVTEGEAFSFTCQATGWPIPTVQWTRGSVSVMQMGGSITYTENIASRSNDGNYNCTATNTVGSETESRSVLVIDRPTDDEVMSNITFERSVGFNGTDPIIGFSIAVGVTALVSLCIGSLTLICCIITVCINCCYTAPKMHDIYEDWPDGEQQGARAAGKGTVGGVGGVDNGDQWVDDQDRRMEASPSEVGAIV